jgi:ubiquinone/menaquinone biosynthesis C-methylase UbiE
MDHEVKSFYDEYGIKEWNRLEENAYSRINYLLHMHFIKDHLKPGMNVLDAGCGSGRFSIEFAQMGCKVTLLDISNEQLRIAKEKIAEAEVNHNIEGILQADLNEKLNFDDALFDVIVCYGAPLSYILERRDEVIKEFHRLLKPNGKLFVSVNNKWGILKMLIGRQMTDFFSDPEYWMIDQVIATGDLPKHEKVNQPARHFFEAQELRALFENNGFNALKLGGSPCISCGNQANIEEMSKNSDALNTIVNIEIASYTKESMLDNGEFLLAMGVKK